MGWAADPNASSGAGQGADVGARGAETDPGARPPERYRAPWEPPSATPSGPENFLPGPLPPGFDERAPGGPASSTPDGRTPTETPSAPSAPPAPPSPPAPSTSPGSPTTSPSAPTASPLTPSTAPTAPTVPPPPPALPPTPAHAPPPPTAPTVPTAPTAPSAPTVSASGTAAPVAPASYPSTLKGAPASERPPLPAHAPNSPASAAPPAPSAAPERAPDPQKDYVGSGPPTYDAEPTALPLADPDELDDLVADTVLDGARYGAWALRAVSVRGDSARYRGEPRRDSLLTARFGAGEHALILVAMATGARATPGAHRAAAEACRWIGRAVGRSHVRLAEDIRAARRGDLKSGLHRLTDRSLGRLRASAAEQGLAPEEYAATLRCLLLPADPDCRTRVFFGVGSGGLFRLRGGVWQDIEPQVGEVAGEPVVGFGSLPAETPEGDRLTMDLGITTPPNPYDPAPEPPREPFRFRASVARPGDTLLMCSGGLAEPLRGEPELSAHLTGRWSGPTPPGLAAFLADTQVRVKGYSDDRTAAAVWEA
ncbi:PP2C family serine/threonine-protein phosphatase [Streptomyces sp900129855]|uniref:PP2C family serine/threonine-protein phosphatase n=1 Tax=Streptomyces sp. 900129855 TaxID=3155129 RepID=A0ABV2ZNM3_9ACTN